jgi:hypothetical protein
MSSKSIILQSHLLLITAVFLSSCSEDFFSQEIDNNLPSDPKAVVQFHIEYDDKTAPLLLSESLPIYGGWQSLNTIDRLEFISDASINLDVEGVSDIEIVQNANQDTSIYNYILNNTAGWIENTAVQLQIETEKFGTITASERIPRAPEVLEASWREETRYNIEEDQDYYVLQIKIQKRGEQFFHFRFTEYVGQFDLDLNTFNDSRPALLQPDDFNEGGLYHASSSTSEDILDIEIEFPSYSFASNLTDSSKFRIYPASNSESYYNIFSAQNNGNFENGPFSEPVVFPSNVDGAIGNMTTSHNGTPVVISFPEE